jgi:7-carboxy-7-deazaguanine synthase
MRAHINEIFSSIQGEGIYVGVRQIFIRFNRCNLQCSYCDTRETFSNERNNTFSVEIVPGTKKFQWFSNPVEPIDLFQIVQKLRPENHHSLSITGVEPLLHEAFLLKFLPLLKGICPVFLETNGTLYKEMKNLLSFIDIISMDIKLPTVTNRDLWNRHEEFLQIAREKNLYVKLVITGETTEEEVCKSAQLIRHVDCSIPLVLQPVAPLGKVKAVASDKIIAFQDLCSSYLDFVRVIPQMHKQINQL